MNLNSMDRITATDRRRAAVLLAHAAGGDMQGVRAVMTEDATDDGVLGLLIGLVEVILTISPPLRTPEGVELLRRVAAGYTHLEHGGEA